MSLVLRLLLILGALFLMWVVLKHIRKARIQIEDSLFWVSFVAIIIFIAIFPDTMRAAANLLGFVSASNFVFLCVTGILLIRLFTLSVEISRLKYRSNQLAAYLALAKKEERDRAQRECASVHAARTSEDAGVGVGAEQDQSARAGVDEHASQDSATTAMPAGR